MTNPNKAHVTLVCDRTGSMSGLQAETEKGVNAFINDRKVDPVDVSLLLVQFDAQDPFEVLHDGPVASAPEYHLAPRGLTPLLDCVGRAIVRTGESLAALAEDERPDKVVFVIATDGLENASTEYTWASVQEMIKRQTDDYSWQFVYLGIAADAWGQEAQLGVTVHTNSSATAASRSRAYANASEATAAYFVTNDVSAYGAALNVDIDDEGNIAARPS